MELEPTEVAPLARVPRHRFAFALAVTVAALPILVLDNLPATAASAEKVSSAEVATQADAPTTLPTLAPTATTAPAPTTTAPPVALAAVAPPRATTTTPAAPTRKTVAPLRTTPTTQPPTTTTAPPPPAAATANGDPNDPGSWDRMAQCEAGGNWAANTGNGYYGGLQFSLGTWRSYGGTGYPNEASKATQIAIGKRLQAAKGWSAWPGCARRLGFT